MPTIGGPKELLCLIRMVLRCLAGMTMALMEDKDTILVITCIAMFIW